MLSKSFKTNFIKYSSLFLLVFFVPILVIVLYRSISHYIYLLPYIAETTLQKISLPFFELFSITLLLRLYFQHEEAHTKKTKWNFIFIFLLINLIVYQYLYRYYTFTERLTYPKIQAFLPYLNIANIILIIGTIVIFSLSEYFPKTISFLSNLNRTLDDHLNQPTPHQEIPTSKNLWEKLVGKFHREGGYTLLILLLMFILGLCLRIYNLGGFEPYVDEYIHLTDARGMLLGEIVKPGRSFYTVTLPTYLGFKIFGMSLWSGRLPMILLNMLAIFPLYALSRRLNKIIALVAVALYATSPWIIAVSRTVREYAVLPFFMYLSAYLLLELLDWDGTGFVKFLWQYKIHLLILLAIFLYPLYDFESISKIIYTQIAAFGFFMILRIMKQKSSWLLRSVIILGGILIIALLIDKTGILFRKNIVHDATFTYWEALGTGNLSQWYYLAILLYPIIFLSGLYSFHTIFSQSKKSQNTITFAFLVFTIQLFYFSIFLSNPFLYPRLRYGILIEYWYVIMVAFSLYALYLIAHQYLPKIFQLPSIALLALLFFNWNGIWTAISYTGGGNLPMTAERHFNLDKAMSLLQDKITSSDVLISDILGHYDEITSNVLHPQQKFYIHSDSQEGKTEFRSIIEEYPQGWIAFSPNVPFGSFGLHQEDTYLDDTRIQFLGKYGEIFIWRWQEGSS